jgi:hypothetical protein
MTSASPADPPRGPRLSVIVASVDATRTLGECIRRLRRSCASLDAELIVVDASRESAAARNAAEAADSVVVLPYGTLVPRLWAEGYRRSRGRIVAFTLGQCLVAPAWAPALVAAFDRGATGAGGPFAIADGTGPIDWAIFYLRYSAFMAAALGSGRTEGEIAGDNAAYRRDALDRHAAAFDDGFWEIDFHRRVRSDGGWLAAVPEAGVEYAGSAPLRTMIGHRFAHGRHFGTGRARSHGRLRIVAAAPIVPFVLAARAARRVAGSIRERWRFLAALPWFLALAAAWAVGEARGALTATPAVAAIEGGRRPARQIRGC